MPRNIVKGKFFSTDLTITANQTYTTTTPTMRCENVAQMHVSVKAAGKNASSSGTVTVAFKSLVGDNNNWSTDTWQTLTVDVSGTAVKVSAAELFNTRGLSAIKVASITNGDASYDIDNVNVEYGLEIA